MRTRPGPLLAMVPPIANVVAWVLFPPAGDGRSDFMRQLVAEMVASTAVILFGVALLLSTRARFLEPMFGGLDKMYRNHREVSVAGFLLLVLHVGVVPWRLAPGGGVPAGLLAPSEASSCWWCSPSARSSPSPGGG